MFERFDAGIRFYRGALRLASDLADIFDRDIELPGYLRRLNSVLVHSLHLAANDFPLVRGTFYVSLGHASILMDGPKVDKLTGTG